MKVKRRHIRALVETLGYAATNIAKGFTSAAQGQVGCVRRMLEAELDRSYGRKKPKGKND